MPFVTYHFPETFKLLKSLGTNPLTRHPIFQCLTSAASKTFFFSSDPVLLRPHVLSLRTIAPQTVLLIGYCLLPFTLSHCFERTVACNAFAVFVTNREVIYVCKVADIFRFTFGERFLEALDVHKTLLTERMSCAECLRRRFSFHVTYYCLTERGPIL